MSDAAEESSVGRVHRFHNVRRIVWRFAAGATVAAWTLGTLLWLTVQDAVPVLSGLYYALPLPVLILAGSIVCVELCRRGCDRRMRAMCLGILFGQMLLWGMQAFRFPVEMPPERSCRFVFWNVCRGYLGYDGVAQELQNSGADVIALVESTGEAEYPEFWTARLRGYSAMRLGSGMMILCRGEIIRMQPGNVTVDEYPEAVCRYRIISLRVDDQPLRVLLMDVKSHPLMVREPAFSRLQELTGELADQPLIVAADFNTPINSVWVDQLRSQLTNSFEEAGQGYRETWPTLLPVLCLDQVWGNNRITFQRSRHGWSLRSDHRSITTEFSIEQ